MGKNSEGRPAAEYCIGWTFGEAYTECRCFESQDAAEAAFRELIRDKATRVVLLNGGDVVRRYFRPV